MSYKPDSLFSLLEQINVSLFLPHIQRPFVWDEDQMRRLFDSLMRNYPIQTFLFWRTKDEIKARRFMDIIDWDVDLSDFYDAVKSQQDQEKVLVLDGQQRIQSLRAIFRGGIRDVETQHVREAYVDLTSGVRDTGDDLRYPVTFASESLEVPHYRIADLLSRDAQKNAEEIADRVNDALDPRLSEQPDERKARQKQIRRNVGQLVSLLREDKYFWIQQLDGVASEYVYKTILDIFVRVNSGGTKLEASDLMFAAMKEGWGDIEEAIEDAVELLNGTNLQFDKTFALKCLLITEGQGAEASPEKFTGPGGPPLLASIERNWERSELAFRELRDFMMQDLKVFADKVLRSYNSFIPLFDFLFHNPKPDERSKALMRAYHYKAQLFGWFSQSTDTLVNSLHTVVGKPCTAGFPLEEIKDYMRSSRGQAVELQVYHLRENRLRFILLNLIYVDKIGTTPFDVKYKGNEPHVDHIYPRHALRTRLSLASGEVNHLGNYRFVGATDNIRKRGEFPASYFTRLKASGVDIEKHLLLPAFSRDPSRLAFDVDTYRDFRDSRLQAIWEIASRVVNAEMDGQRTEQLATS